MTTVKKTDYVLEDRTNANWPGVMSWRSRSSRSSRTGYATREEAEERARVVRDHYAARHGCAGPDLRVVEREVAR